MPIYTRRGDSGETGLADGTRLTKASARIEALGALDEAGAAIGFARAAVLPPDLDAILRFAQQRLFNCGAILAGSAPAGPDSPTLTAADVGALETAIDRFEAASPWRGFTLASGGEAAARIHLARATARRAERRLAALHADETVAPEVLAFANRLSDLLYAAARAANVAEGTPEDPWNPSALPPGAAE